MIFIPFIVIGLILYPYIIRKNSYYLIFSMYMLSLSAIIFSSFIYISKSTVFQFPFRIDYLIYTHLSMLRLPIPLISRLYNISIALFLLSSYLSIKKLKQSSGFVSFMMYLSIILFILINDVSFSKYLHIMTSSAPNLISRTFWREIIFTINLVTEILFLFFTAYPIIILIVKTVRSKIYLNRRHSIILLSVLSVIHGFVYITLKITYSGVWPSNTDMSKIPVPNVVATGFFIPPIILFFMFASVAIMIMKLKPNGALKLVTNIQWIEQNFSLSDGIGMAFHTHKNALIALRQHLELIRIYMKKEDTEKIEEHIDISYNVINAQLESIHKTLKNLQNNRAPARQVDLGECIRSVAKKFSYDGYLEQKLLDGCVVLGDHDALCEVFLNVLFNAEYALKERDDPQIKIKMLKEDDFIEIDIWDNGCGISKENIRHIFTPFFSTKPALHYGGLGLSSVRSTIHAHRGEVKVKSEEGKYTVIKMVFPAYTKAQ